MRVFEALGEWLGRWRNLLEVRALDGQDRLAFSGFFHEQIKLAQEAFLRGNKVQAFETWKEMHTQYPNISRTSEKALNLLVDLGRYDQAEALVREARGRNRRHRELYATVLARIAFERGDLQEAMRRLEVLRRQFPLAVSGYTIAATCLTKLGREAEAEAMLEQGVRKRPDDLDALVAYARFAERRKDWPEALRRWDAVRDRPDRLSRWVGLLGMTQSLRGMGRYPEADKLATESIEQFPSVPWFYVEFAEIAVARGDLEEAARRWDLARRRCPYHGPAYAKGVELARKSGREADADEILCVAVLRMRYDLSLHLEYARAAHKRGDWAVAAERWEFVRERFPACDEAREQRAVALAAAERQDPPHPAERQDPPHPAERRDPPHPAERHGPPQAAEIGSPDLSAIVDCRPSAGFDIFLTRAKRDANTMEIGSDAEIAAAVDAFIAGREAGEVLRAVYHRRGSFADVALDTLAGLLPDEQIGVATLAERLRRPGLPAVVILLAALRKIRGDESWIHYNLAKHLTPLLDAGVLDAKLPAIIHAQFAVEGLKERPPGAVSLPLGVLASELTTFAPREAIRSGMLAARRGDGRGLRAAAPAFAQLGLDGAGERPPIAQMLHIAKALRFGPENIPQVTSIGDAAGLRSTVIEPPRRVVFPSARGDTSHYNFVQAGREIDLPGITVHTLESGTFSIDATARGLEHHYVFDRNRDCVLDLSNGTAPFIEESVLECEEPVAILDDSFSGAMNICHFLLDRVTRIPIYERAWSRPGKFFLVDDPPYYREILTRIGLADRIIMPSSKRVSIRAPELLVSSNIAADFRHPAHYCAGWAIDYLRRELGIEERPCLPGRKLMVSRADTNGRDILNWDEVVPVFHRHGFEIVLLSGLSAEAQIALFRDAAQVVGVHGAGLTNILFAPRDCAVLEILPPLVAVPDYWLLASGLGQRYSALIAEDPELPRPDYTVWRHDAGQNRRDIVLPVDRLEAALAALDDPLSAEENVALATFRRGQTSLLDGGAAARRFEALPAHPGQPVQSNEVER